MCGIAGLHSSRGEPQSVAVVEAMCALLRHRGPDDHGLWAAGPVALGHRRLSILDLSTRGRNPLANEDGTVQLVFNGEIYNFRELRRELAARGHRLHSDTDCETVVHLYEELGSSCVERLEGMFAFALWDARRQRLLLARDRYGIKPLYYVSIGTTLAFASEIKAFLAVPGFAAGLDAAALAEHLTFQNTFGEETLFSGVRLLAPAHRLVCEDGEVRRERYWEMAPAAAAEEDVEPWTAALREAFERAVGRQLVADVPLGSYLSGGMDTGAIVAVATRTLPGMHTFTCGFEVPPQAAGAEFAFDERQASFAAADALGTVHHELTLGPEAMASALPHVVWHLDEPRVGISYQVLYTAEMVRRHVTVVLSGVGGDELFAGYPWRYEPMLAVAGDAFAPAYYRHWLRLLDDDEKRRLFTGDLRRRLGDFSSFERFRQALPGNSADPPLERALRFDFATFLPGLLVVEDKLTMAHGVETRVPFLDDAVVDLAWRIPAACKLRPGLSKVVLRRAMAGLVPVATLERPKQGFTPPDESWYRHHLMGQIRDTLLSRRARERGLFEPQGVAAILDDHLAGRRNHRQLIWSLLALEWWQRLFLDREPLPVPMPVGAATATSVRGRLPQATAPTE
jgi:asparagine synthase (glutamine-hydrolysing)